MPRQPDHCLRRARLDDAAEIAMLFQLVYQASSHPCKSEEFVASSLQRTGADVWHVSECDGRVSGCMGMLPHRWNRSWEIVRGVTHPDFRGGGLATALAQRAIDDAWSSGECDMVIGYPRNRTMARILADLVTPGLHVVGHDGGINIAGGCREYHLVAVSCGPTTRLERVSPNRGGPSASAGAFAEAEVLRPMGFAPAPSEYPPVLIAGEYPWHPDYGPFTFSYHPFCPSDSIEITCYSGAKTDQQAVAEDLLVTLESFGYVQHTRLAVLADKTEFQHVLRRGGFAATAYLPAWHLQNGVRYDCVLMTRRTTAGEPVDHGTREFIDRFNQGYA